MDPGGFPRVCRKGVEEAGREQRGHHTANPRRCGKLPETPAQTVERAWVTPRVTISRKGGWNSRQATLHLCSLNGNKARAFRGRVKMGTQVRPLQAAQIFKAEMRQEDCCWQDPEKVKPHLLEQGAGG